MDNSYVTKLIGYFEHKGKNVCIVTEDKKNGEIDHTGTIDVKKLVDYFHSKMPVSGYSAVQCSAVQCSAVQCSAVQCSEEQCSEVQCRGLILQSATID
jgi:hypothetical protein